MWAEILVGIIAGSILGLITYYFLRREIVKKPIVIDIKHYMFDWIEPIGLSTVVFVALFFGEVCMGMFLPAKIGDATCQRYLAKLLVENGVVIFVISAIVSLFFEHSVKKRKLHDSKYYSENVSKVCLSIIIIIFSLGFLAYILIQDNYRDFEVVTIHCLMWILSVIGTWIGIGFGCKKEKNETDTNIKCKNKENKKKLLYWAPILMSLVPIVAAVAFPYLFIKYNATFTTFVFVFMVLLLGSFYKLINEADPSIKKSKAALKIAFEEAEQGSTGEFRFGRIRYKIKNDQLVFLKSDVVYPDHNDDPDFKELFHGEPKKITDDDGKISIKIAEEILTDLDAKQTQYIKDAFDLVYEEGKGKVKR